MKKIVFLLLSFIGSTATVQAQTFTQHLLQQKPGNGKITISQSRDIDDLVNGKNAQEVNVALRQTVKDNMTPKKTIIVEQTKKTVQNKKTEQTKKTGQVRKAELATRAEQAARETQEAKADSIEKARERWHREQEEKAQAQKAAEEEFNIPTVDMRKKVMRGARKVTGYRVQAFAGGNTRTDKNKAQQAGNAIKMRFPDQPIYVHFYSPRWICRVGNYRSLDEARRMLSAVKAMGYKSAIIVKGRITVFE